jgi:hypothetical protein
MKSALLLNAPEIRRVLCKHVSEQRSEQDDPNDRADDYSEKE